MRSEFIFKTREEGIKHLRSIARDFAEQIAPVYRLVQWTWGGGGYTPTVDKIEENLNKLIDSFEDRDSEYISCGGLVLECEKYEKEEDEEDEEEFYEMKMSMVIDHSALFRYIFGEDEEEEC